MNAPARPIPVLNATYLEDLKTYIVHMGGDSSHKYKIGDLVYRTEYNQPYDVEVADLSDIKRIHTTTVITHYVDKTDCTTIMSEDRYEEEIRELQSKGTLGEDEHDYVFGDLDDEYAYKKFKRKWMPITDTLITHTSDVEFHITKTVYNTNSLWITPLFSSIKLADRGLVRVNRIGSQRESFLEIVNEIGIMEHVNIPNHSHLRFVQLYKEYVFNEEWHEKNNPPQTLTLVDARKLLANDRDKIRSIVLAKYNRMTGNVNMEKFPWGDLMTSLRKAHTNIDAVRSSVRTSTEYRHAKNNLKEAMEIVEKGLAQK